MESVNSSNWIPAEGRCSAARISIDGLIDAVRSVRCAAIDALWSFYTRPISEEVRWFYADCDEGLSCFLRSVGESPGDLAKFCRRTLSYEALVKEEEQALSEYIAVYQSASGGSPPPEGKSSGKIFQWSSGNPAKEDADERLIARQATAVPTDLRYEGIQYQVIVRNLSSRGALIDGLQKGKLDQRTSVNLPSYGWIEGSIAWSLGDRCGVAFNYPI